MSNILSNAENIRNICILAHVDHGKTTLADSLVASNGIISQRLAGQLRYMDSRQDEQERGITMKSSSITLTHKIVDEEGKEGTFVINLIDSPGHVDFYGEVSAAVRLCDGCLIIVDVVEGVCPQTMTALRQAWIEGLKPVLILNKMDRLYFEKKMEPIDAYNHLIQILERINVVQGELWTSGVLKQDGEDAEDLQIASKDASTDNKSDDLKDGDAKDETEKGFTFDWTSPLDAVDDSVHYFSPEANNVIFASAIDSWAFTIETFSSYLSSKYQNMSKSVLNRTLWGDYYLDKKKARIFRGAMAKAKKPMFVSMILESLWTLFEAIERNDLEKLEKVVQVLNVNVSKRDLKHTDQRVKIRSIMSQWLPLSGTVLSVVISLIPSPLKLTAERVEHLMCSRIRKMESLPDETQKLKMDFLNCSNAEDATKIVCVSKMVPMDTTVIRNVSVPKKRSGKDDHLDAGVQNDNLEADQDKDGVHQDKPDADENSGLESTFIAFARIFSGRIKVGDTLYVLGPKYDPNRRPTSVDPGHKLIDLDKDAHVTAATIKGIHILMGRDLIHVKEASAGMVIGLSGLEGHILKSATLSNSLFCPPFVDLHISAPPVLKVAIEPEDLTQMANLIVGLKLLNQSDPNVRVQVEESGEHVIISPGEVHLQKCIDDLESSFAGIKLKVSEPIVPFRETIVDPPKFDMVNESIHGQQTSADNVSKVSKRVQEEEETFFTASKRCSISLKVKPIPDAVSNYILENIPILKLIAKDVKLVKSEDVDRFKDGLINIFNESEAEMMINNGNNSTPKDDFWWTPINETIDKIISFGPKNVGANLLIDTSGAKDVLAPFFRDGNQDKNEDRLLIRNELESSIINGFQLASLSGPLCEEPMMGVAILVTNINLPGQQFTNSNLLITGDQGSNYSTKSSSLKGDAEDGDNEDADDDKNDRKRSFGPLAGQLMSTVREGCRKVFLNGNRRLKLAMFTCTIQVSQDAQRKMYAVVHRRHGQVVKSDQMEGCQTWMVEAMVPVIESFKFADEIRKQTSGLANPQLVFSHWETLDIDPFWVPSTEEEYQHFGQKADCENRARKYVNMVRRRKGLAVDEQVIERAERQRTLTRNK